MKKKSNIYNFILTIIAFLIPIIFYNKLPNLMPSHFGISGQVDSYINKNVGAFLAPVIMIAIWIGMVYLPKVDPRRSHYAKFAKSYGLILSLLITFFFIIQLVIISVSLGVNVPVNKVIPFTVGLMFIVIGNYMPKSKSNFFYGIKTPWTLSSETSWRKTHKLGGILFVLSGIVIAIISLIFNGYIIFPVLIACVIVMVLVLFCSSYIFAKRAGDFKK